MSESRGTSFRLLQLRKSPRTGTRRNPPSDGANRNSRFARRLVDSAILFLHEETSEEQGVHAGAEKCADRIGWRVHDGLAAQIEGSIHDDGDAGTFAKFVDQAVVERIDFLLDGLWTRAAVHVGDCGNDAALFRTHLRCENHERGIVCGFQIFRSSFLLERRRKWSPPFAEFYRVV